MPVLDEQGHGHLSCGCEMWREGTMFYVKPCSPNCQYYIYAIKQAKKMGHKFVFKGLKNITKRP